MSYEKKIMLVITIGALIGIIVGYCFTLPYMLACSLTCFIISSLGTIASEKA